MKKILFVNVDGNIGCGKTTLIKKIIENYKDNEKILILPMFESCVSTEEGLKLLKLFYSDSKKYAYQLNFFILESFGINFREIIKKVIKSDLKCIILIDRSLKSNFEVFVTNHYNNGTISKEEYHQLEMIYTELDMTVRHLSIVWNIKIQNFYIHEEVEKCIENITERLKNENREGEETIKLDYLKKIEKLSLELFSGIILKDGRINNFNVVIDYINNFK